MDHLRSHDPRPDTEACLGFWLVNSPHFHPFWSWWYIAMTHLREIPGTRPPRRAYSEAAYEFVILSLDPTRGDPSLESLDFAFLDPPDVVEHLSEGISDSQALSIGEAAVRAICLGQLSPDQDYRSLWREELYRAWRAAVEG